MLLISLSITLLILVKSTNTILDKKQQVDIIIIRLTANLEKKRLNHECLKVLESISLAEKECWLSKSKKAFKTNILNDYFENLQ